MGDRDEFVTGDPHACDITLKNYAPESLGSKQKYTGRMGVFPCQICKSFLLKVYG